MPLKPLGVLHTYEGLLVKTVIRQIVVNRDGTNVWEFVKDMGNWARQMPGYVSHELINEFDSVWTMQVNVGTFTRPVLIDVHVIEWRAPTEVTFELKGRSDPFRGAGVFRACPDRVGTKIVLELGVEGTGSMAKMISAMVPPVLNYVGDGFSVNLAKALGGEESADVAVIEPTGFKNWLSRVINKILSTVIAKRL